MVKLKTGIVGCGKVAHLHAKAFSGSDTSHFTAVCGREPGKTALFAEVYGVKPYVSVAEMVRREKLDVVSVCTPHPLHRENAVAALRCGAHVLVEKPLASSLEDSTAMLDETESLDRIIGVVSQRSFYPSCTRMKTALTDGKLGKPVLCTVNMLGWRDEEYYGSDPWRGTWKGEGGGVLVNQAPHYLDLMHWFMGDVDELYGTWGNLNHPYIEVDDTALAILKFKSGAIGNIVVSNSQKPGIYGKIHVHGANGASVGAQTDGGAMFIAGMSDILQPPVNDLWTIPGEEDLPERWIREDSDFFQAIHAVDYYHQLQVDDFLRAVLEEREPLVSGQDGHATVEILTAIYRSARDGKPVRFPLLPEPGRDDFDGRVAGGVNRLV